MSITITNRYNDTFTLTIDKGSVLWEGDFKYCRTGFDESMNTNFIDPSGGPFIALGADLGRFHPDLKGMIVEGFIEIDTGYKLIIR